MMRFIRDGKDMNSLGGREFGLIGVAYRVGGIHQLRANLVLLTLHGTWIHQLLFHTCSICCQGGSLVHRHSMQHGLIRCFSTHMQHPHLLSMVERHLRELENAGSQDSRLRSAGEETQEPYSTSFIFPSSFSDIMHAGWTGA